MPGGCGGAQSREVWSLNFTFMFVNFYAGYFVLPHVASVIGARILAMITSENITEIIDRKFVYK